MTDLSRGFSPRQCAEEEARTLEAQNNTWRDRHNQILAIEPLKKRLAT
jgi:hypothetical protein